MTEEVKLSESTQRKIQDVEKEKEDLLQRVNTLDERILHLKSGKV